MSSIGSKKSNSMQVVRSLFTLLETGAILRTKERLHVNVPLNSANNTASISFLRQVRRQAITLKRCSLSQLKSSMFSRKNNSSKTKRRMISRQQVSLKLPILVAKKEIQIVKLKVVGRN
jgi:hypothetical protein